MRASARGFLLLSFAFSSVLSSAEVPPKTPDAASFIQATANNSKQIETQKKKIQTQIDHELEKRSAGIFSETFNGEEEKKKDLESPNTILDRDDLDKRSRLGFTGMRGKKEFSPETFCARLLGLNSGYGFNYNKRLTRSFYGGLGDKRAPLAFHGMRGKKSDEFDNEIIDPFEYKNREFLIDSGLLDDPESEFSDPRERKSEEILDTGDFSKRSPYAFQGMRGKKENGYDLKRAMGFLGMRGKKATDIWDSDSNFVNYKRIPQTGFFGMKGKKAQSGFFGMRGKKGSQTAFFGIKGKREPLDYDFQDVSSLNQMKELDSSRNRFRRGIAVLNNSKKAKNAFFGIRGKKSTQETEKSATGKRNYFAFEQFGKDDLLALDFPQIY